MRKEKRIIEILQSFIPPNQRVKGRRSGEGREGPSSIHTMTRMRALPNELDPMREQHVSN